MGDKMTSFLIGICVNLSSEFLVVVVGVLFAQFIRSWYDRRRYGGWQVIVKRGDTVIDVRPVSSGKIKQVNDIPEDLSVFLKGVASGYEWINCDLVTEGRNLGLLVEDKVARKIVIDLDKNPPASQPVRDKRG